MEERLRRRIERVRDIDDDGSAAGERERNVERVRGISFERCALFPYIFPSELVSAFSEPEKKGEERGACAHVIRDVNLSREATRCHAKDEAEREKAHVEIGDFFELEGVGEVLDEVDRRHQA